MTERERKASINDFKKYLKRKERAENTIISYADSVNLYYKQYTRITSDNLLLWKSYLMENMKPRGVNSRINGINAYLKFIDMPDLKLKCVKVQRRQYLDNVISNSDYKYLKSRLRRDKELVWFYLIWTMAATGARVSEVVKFKVEHIEMEFMDIYAKGEKNRRLFVPAHLKRSMLNWFKQEKITSGHIFVTGEGNLLQTKYIETRIKGFAVKYHIDPVVMYPHSFRHLFGKNFIEKYQDLALLADIMGHSSVETTRIYVLKTSAEQQSIINSIVNW